MVTEMFCSIIPKYTNYSTKSKRMKKAFVVKYNKNSRYHYGKTVSRGIKPYGDISAKKPNT